MPRVSSVAIACERSLTSLCDHFDSEVLLDARDVVRAINRLLPENADLSQTTHARIPVRRAVLDPAYRSLPLHDAIEPWWQATLREALRSSAHFARPHVRQLSPDVAAIAQGKIHNTPLARRTVDASYLWHPPSRPTHCHCLGDSEDHVRCANEHLAPRCPPENYRRHRVRHSLGPSWSVWNGSLMSVASVQGIS